MFDTKKALKQIDENIARCLYKSYNDVFTNLNFNTIEFNYYNIDSNLVYTDKMALNDYLFLKVKEYYYSILFTNLVFLFDYKYNLHITNLASPTASVLFTIYGKTYNTNLKPTNAMEKTYIEKEYKNNKTYTVNLLSNYQELTKKLKKLHTYFYSNQKEEVLNPFLSSNPSILFQSIIHKSFSYDFFQFNTPFKYLMVTHDYKNVPIDFAEYIILNLILFYGDKNKISSSKNIINKTSKILQSLDQKNRYPEYNDLREIIEEKYNSSINKINSVKKVMDINSYKGDVYYYLFNTYFHNQFFNGYNHPLIKLISKRISIQELYNDTKHIFTNDSSDKQLNDSLVSDYSIDESFYYLELICLLLEFNINFNSVDENQFYSIKTRNEYFYSAKEDKLVTLQRLENNEAVFKLSQEKKKIIDAHLDFIYNFLNSVEPRNHNYFNVFELEHVASLFKYIQTDIEKDEFLKIILDFQEELNKVYSQINKPNLKCIDLTNDDFIYDHFYLTTYLLKYSFIRDLKHKK